MKSRELVVIKWLIENYGWSSPNQTVEEFLKELSFLTKDVKVVHKESRRNNY